MFLLKRSLNLSERREGRPTILLDMPTCFVIGHLFILVAAKEVGGQKIFWTFPMKMSLAYASFIFIPITGWYFYAHTGWSTVYLRDETLIPGWAGPLILSFYFLGMLFGAGLSQALIQAGQLRAAKICLGLGCFWLLSLALLTSDEYAHIGTFAQYHRGIAPLIFSTPQFMTELNIMGALLALPAIAIAIIFYRRSRKLAK